MSVLLREEQCYGISSHTLDLHGGTTTSNNISVFHVKLTDSAARAIETFQNNNSKAKSSHPAIRFNGNQGRITVPCAENSDEVRTFTFGLTNVARDNPHGSFDCVQQLSTGAPEEELSCVGVIQEKMTVNATDESYHQARRSVARAEEETRSRGAIVIKQGGRVQGKRVTVRAPAPALANLAKRRRSPSSESLLGGVRRGLSRPKKGAFASSDRNGACVVDKRPLRERLTHLLALRPYRRPELVLRLQRDGLATGDKDSLDTLLLEVGQLNSRDNTYVLKGSLYKELQHDWPGYTTGDQQLMKRILVRRLFQPHRHLLSVPGTQVSPLRDTPNSSPAHPHKLPLIEDYTDPLANKKPRISHVSSKAANDRSGSKGSSEGQRGAAKDGDAVTGATEDDSRRNSLNPRLLFDSLSEVCEQKVEAARRLEPATSIPKDSKDSKDPSPLTVPRLERHSRRRRKSKHKHRDRNQEKVKSTESEDMKGGRASEDMKGDRASEDMKGDRASEDMKGDRASEDMKGDPASEDVKGDPASEDKMESKDSIDDAEPNGMFYDDSVTKAANDMTDYLLKYTVICSRDQRQSYKQDFNQEYSEYRGLHARIDGVTRQFMKLDVQRKRLRRGSHRYQTVHNQIVQEYRKIKKSNPNYSQDKIRCEYLHNKLAHIKKLISEYDQNQLTMVSS